MNGSMSEGRLATLRNPRASLSGQLREASKKQIEERAKTASGSRPQRSNTESVFGAGHAFSASLLNGPTFPSLVTKKQSTFADTVALYARGGDPFTRLSGLVETVNSSGIYADITAPMKPLPLCVRCSDHASLCMACAEESCEKTVTFYRKTRAAGAAALFTKAFVEAGNTKVIKFIIFRLMKNSFFTRKREQLKKKSVVEKLFGANLVYLPFTAWRRYTKENIVKRKDKMVTKMGERVRQLEDRVAELTAAAQRHENVVSNLREENAQLRQLAADKNERILQLESRLAQEQARVLSLTSLALPLTAYQSVIQALLSQKLVETNHYLHTAATISLGYDYSHIFEDKVLAEIGQITHERVTTGPRHVTKASLSKTLAASHQILVDWTNSVSQSVDHYLEPTTGKMLSSFLPAHSPIETLSELRTGKVLCRVVVAVILDRCALCTAVTQRAATTAMTAPSSSSSSSSSSLEAEDGSQTARLTRSWAEPRVSVEELHDLKAAEAQALDLVTLTLRLAARALDLPAIKAADILAGKTPALQTLLVALMNASVPTVPLAARQAVEKSISQYYHLAEQVEGWRAQHAAVQSLTALTQFFNKEARSARTLVNPHPPLLADVGETSADLSLASPLPPPRDEARPTEAALSPERGEAHTVGTRIIARAHDLRLGVQEGDTDDSDGERDAGRSSGPDRQTASLDPPPPGRGPKASSAGEEARGAALSADVQRYAAWNDLRSPATPAAETAALSPHEAQTRARARKGHLAMSAQCYDAMCRVLDAFIQSRDYLVARDLSHQAVHISDQLTALQTAVFQRQEALERGVAMTTELRQFVLNAHLASTVVQ